MDDYRTYGGKQVAARWDDYRTYGDEQVAAGQDDLCIRGIEQLVVQSCDVHTYDGDPVEVRWVIYRYERLVYNITFITISLSARCYK